MGKIMIVGYSCGGIEVLEFVNDFRVFFIGILNFGLLGNYDFVGIIWKLFIVMFGGFGDIVYQNVSLVFDEINGWEVVWFIGIRENVIIVGFCLVCWFGREILIVQGMVEYIMKVMVVYM